MDKKRVIKMLPAEPPPSCPVMKLMKSWEGHSQLRLVGWQIRKSGRGGHLAHRGGSCLVTSSRAELVGPGIHLWSC